jgi:hypothetical protein
VTFWKVVSLLQTTATLVYWAGIAMDTASGPNYHREESSNYGDAPRVVGSVILLVLACFILMAAFTGWEG